MPEGSRTAWGPVWAMALGVAGLTTAELLPVSLLTPMAIDLGISTGTAGQAVTATAAVAFVAALIVAPVTRRVDRRTLLLGITLLHTVSTLGVALAPSFPFLVAARLLLGLAVGGFWALAASLAMRLARGPDVPRAIGVIFGGSSAAGLAAAPLASFLGGIVGWRAVFLVTLVLGVSALVAQWFTLPSMPSQAATRLSTLLMVGRRPSVALGLVAIFLTFGGSRMLYTYIRPLVDRAAHGDVPLLSLLLLVFGVARFIGSTRSAPLHRRSLRGAIAGSALVIAVVAGLLLVVGTVLAPLLVLLVVWGICDAVIAVGWSTWVTRAVADHPETGGGLQVGTIQVSIVAGAALGGLLVDAYGVTGVAVGACALMLGGAVQVLRFVRPPATV